MIGWIGDIEHTLENDTFRTVLFTGEHAQLTVMRLAPGEDIGRERHPDRDQFIRIEEGQARIELSSRRIASTRPTTHPTTGRSWCPPARGTT